MSQAVKVGIFMTICLVVLAFFILRIEDIRLLPGGEMWRIDALFDSVAGLDNKAAVRVAGVRVGRVDGIRLEGEKARVTLLLEEPVPLTQGSTAAIASIGLLGDKYVELRLGPPGAPGLPEDAVLPGETPITFDEALARFSRIGESIERVTGGLVDETGESVLAQLFQNLEATSADVRALVAANREQLTATVDNFAQFSATLAQELPGLARQMEEIAGEIQGILRENRGNLQASLSNVRQITDNLQTSVGDLNFISQKLARGEGTLGKLLTSDEAHDELVATLDSIQDGVETLSSTLGTIRRLELDLGLEGFYLADLEETQSTFRLDIDSQRDRLYRLALVDTPFGRTRTKTQRITVTRADGSTEVQTVETLTQEDRTTISALFGFRFGDETRLWAGLIESDFGVQVEYPLFRRNLWLSLEAFDFQREDDRNPHLRLITRWHFHPNLYLMGGYDDALEREFRSVLFGGGVRWSDENLKYLLGSVPRF